MCVCVFVFSAWIEEHNIKPFEGPWKDELAKVSKPAAFRHAMADIDKYVENPAEIDSQIDESCGMGNHTTEADFDKIRDGLDSDESPETGADGNNGVVPHVVGSPDESDGLTSNAAVENNATSPTTTPTVKSQVKRTPKAKSSAAVAVSSKQASKAASAKSAAAQKRRISAQHTPTGASSAKRGRRAASGEADHYESPNADYDGASSSSLAARARIDTDAFLGTLTKRTPNAIALLDRPVVTRPETQAIDMNSRSNTLADRDIVPSDQTFGFLGLGMMGSTIVKDLIYTKHKVVVWNRTIDKVSYL